MGQKIERKGIERLRERGQKGLTLQRG